MCSLKRDFVNYWAHFLKVCSSMRFTSLMSKSIPRFWKCLVDFECFVSEFGGKVILQKSQSVSNSQQALRRIFFRFWKPLERTLWDLKITIITFISNKTTCLKKKYVSFYIPLPMFFFMITSQTLQDTIKASIYWGFCFWNKFDFSSWWFSGFCNFVFPFRQFCNITLIFKNDCTKNSAPFKRYKIAYITFC